MTNLSPRMWVLMGFGVSLLSVVISIFVLSGIEGRIKEADGEIFKLTESLHNQAAEIDQAEIRSDFFTVLNHISKALSGDEKKAAANESIYMLQTYLVRNYAAVNGISPSEMIKVENEEAAEDLRYLAKASDILKKIEATSDPAEQLRLTNELEAIRNNSSETPKSELGQKLQEARNHADPEELATKSTEEILLAITPYLSTSNEQFIVNYQKKEGRIKELQNRKASLSWWASIATYAAVSLQLFGLMCVMAKDLMQENKE